MLLAGWREQLSSRDAIRSILESLGLGRSYSLTQRPLADFVATEIQEIVEAENTRSERLHGVRMYEILSYGTAVRKNPDYPVWQLVEGGPAGELLAQILESTNEAFVEYCDRFLLGIGAHQIQRVSRPDFGIDLLGRLPVFPRNDPQERLNIEFLILAQCKGVSELSRPLVHAFIGAIEDWCIGNPRQREYAHVGTPSSFNILPFYFAHSFTREAITLCEKTGIYHITAEKIAATLLD